MKKNILAKTSAKKTSSKSSNKTPVSSTKPLPEFEDLIREAFSARKHSHSPYSKFKVGASILTARGKIFSGCNIENASYGGTVCAERVAVWNAISAGAPLPIKAVCVVTQEKDIWPPCGFCRQVLAEFCKPDSLIITANSPTNFKVYKFSELQPLAFTPDFLTR